MVKACAASSTKMADGGDQRRIEFLLALGVGAHGADVGARTDPVLLHQRLLRRGDGDQDVGAGRHRLPLGLRRIVEAELGDDLAEGVQVGFGGVPGEDAADRTHRQRRPQLIGRLRARADDAQRPGVRTGEVLAGDGAGGAGADAGQVVGAHQRRGAAGLGIEQQGGGLMIGQPLGHVVRPVAARLEPQERGADIGAGLHAEHGVLIADDLAHHRVVAGVAPRHGGEGLLHRADGVLDAHQPARQLFGNDQHLAFQFSRCGIRG